MQLRWPQYGSCPWPVRLYVCPAWAYHSKTIDFRTQKNSSLDIFYDGWTQTENRIAVELYSDRPVEFIHTRRITETFRKRIALNLQLGYLSIYAKIRIEQFHVDKKNRGYKYCCRIMKPVTRVRDTDRDTAINNDNIIVKFQRQQFN